VAARAPDEQQQLLYGLVWDAKQEYDLLLTAPRPWQEAHRVGFEVIELLEYADEDINRQMREALTPEQWELYEITIWSAPTNLFDVIGPDPWGRIGRTRNPHAGPHRLR
jgi:hypothetical protein